MDFTTSTRSAMILSILFYILRKVVSLSPYITRKEKKNEEDHSKKNDHPATID